MPQDVPLQRDAAAANFAADGLLAFEHICALRGHAAERTHGQGLRLPGAERVRKCKVALATQQVQVSRPVLAPRIFRRVALRDVGHHARQGHVL